MVWKPHVTVAALVEQNGRFLMVEETIEGAAVYNQPAGHLDDGESLVEAVARETLEETGRRFVPESLVGIYRWRHPVKEHTFMRICFAGACSAHEPGRELDAEIVRTCWLSEAELRERQDRLRSPMVLACIADYARGRRYPLDLLVDLGAADLP